MKNKRTMILLVILAVLVIIAGGLLIYKVINKNETKFIKKNKKLDNINTQF